MGLLQRVSGPLSWTQPKAMERRYVLDANGEELAVLAFHSACGTLATAECPEGRWSFKRVGFLHSRVTVREQGSEQDLAVFQPATWSDGGTLTLADGRTLRVTTNLWQTRVELLAWDGGALVRFTVGGFIRVAVDVEVLPPAATLPELPWLLILGCYLIVSMQTEAATAATLAACC